jgi:D-serine deaminase-like pyridoxal phosphate-dependent protein
MFAHEQIKAGAIGITCQKLGEAEIMAETGITDILITYNILGEAKLERLLALSKICTLSVVADSRATIAGLSDCFANQGKSLPVLIECDTGQHRCGVQNPRQALELAQFVAQSPGLLFGGLMTYPAKRQHEAVNAFLKATLDLCSNNELDVSIVSNGGTPDMLNSHLVTSVTEHRSGTYIYNDRSLVLSNDCSWDDCALRVLATVVSRPTNDRVIVDAGSKSLTSDTQGLEGFGYVVDYPEAQITALHEEHGILDVSNCGDNRPDVGDVLHIIPNHACVVSNMFDQVFLKTASGQIDPTPVTARGQVW